MKSRLFSFAVVLVAVICMLAAVKETPRVVPLAGADEPKAILRLGVQDYLLALATSTGSNISRLKKEEIRTVKELTGAVTAWGYDERRDEVYVAQDKIITVFKIKRPEEEKARYEIPSKGPVTALQFNLMNRSAYVLAAQDRAVWSIDPKKKKVIPLVSSEDLTAASTGKPIAMLDSADGTKFYLLMQEETTATVLRVKFRKKIEVEKVGQFSGLTSGVGLMMYRETFVVWDSAAAKFRGMHLKDGKEVEVPVTGDIPKNAAAFDLDLSDALIVARDDQGAWSVTRRPITVKP